LKIKIPNYTTKYPYPLTQLSSLLNPEYIDSNKLTTILTDTFSFKLNDLIPLLKSTQKKEKILEILKTFKFLQFSEDNEQASYTLPEQFTIISLLNIPHTLSKADLEKLFEINPSNYSRFNKKSLFWILVTEDQEFVKQLEAKLKEANLIVKILLIKGWSSGEV
jgi:hypothetical protein